MHAYNMNLHEHIKYLPDFLTQAVWRWQAKNGKDKKLEKESINLLCKLIFIYLLSGQAYLLIASLRLSSHIQFMHLFSVFLAIFKSNSWFGRST